MDNLRDRIIAAIVKADEDWRSNNPVHEDMADAVIEALDSHGWLIDPESGKRTNKK